jgi:hypothetical protein
MQRFLLLETQQFLMVLLVILHLFQYSLELVLREVAGTFGQEAIDIKIDSLV